jgi:hypothetical protein
MWHESQRLVYLGGSLPDPKNRIVYIGLQYFSQEAIGNRSWLDIFAELLGQANVSEIEAFSVGSWSKTWDNNDPFLDVIKEETEEDEYEDGEDDEDYRNTHYHVKNLDRIVEAIVHSRLKLPNLRFIYLGEDDYPDEFVTFGGANIAALLLAFPKLESLNLRDQVDFRGASSESLKEFSFYSADVYPDFFRQLQQANFPNLERLRFVIGTHYLQREEILGILNCTTFPKLKHLSINYDDHTATSTNILEFLFGTPLMDSLESLDLEGLSFDYESQFKQFYENPPPKNLKQIYLPIPVGRTADPLLTEYLQKHQIDIGQSWKYADTSRFAITRE